MSGREYGFDRASGHVERFAQDNTNANANIN